ncbi:hypothetical protein SCLCIDRAFT_28180 [Scleroderma citrinum Foug A]|uniref:Uncharacterized protein n=1 Tax=Scleroderma citrinum Foug A TaxID=1036808 RepID=A0A0C3DC38_9AGAM|nr:hypothetical protein SCLCIDRAFT_28180 [Scleroderma citrinum Foug A]
MPPHRTAPALASDQIQPNISQATTVNIPTDPIEERHPNRSRHPPHHYHLTMPSNVIDAAVPAPAPTPDLDNSSLITPSSDHATLETFNLDDISDDDNGDDNNESPIPRAWGSCMQCNSGTAQLLNTARSEATDPLLTNPQSTLSSAADVHFFFTKCSSTGHVCTVCK